MYYAFAQSLALVLLHWTYVCGLFSITTADGVPFVAPLVKIYKEIAIIYVYVQYQVVLKT